MATLSRFPSRGEGPGVRGALRRWQGDVNEDVRDILLFCRSP
jgi:hypothetical protein